MLKLTGHDWRHYRGHGSAGGSEPQPASLVHSLRAELFLKTTNALTKSNECTEASRDLLFSVVSKFEECAPLRLDLAVPKHAEAIYRRITI